VIGRGVIHWSGAEGFPGHDELDMVRAMRERGLRTHAVVCAVVLVAFAAACDSHSKPMALQSVAVTAAPTNSTVAAPPTSSAVSAMPVTSTALVPASSAAAAIPTASALAGTSALASEYPSAEAQVPAAIQVVRNFFDGVNRETATGDEALVSTTFTSRCTICGSSVFAIQELRDGGDTIKGGMLHLLSIDSAYPSYRDVVTVQVTDIEDSGQQLDTSGAVIHQFGSAGATKLVFNLDVATTPPTIFQLDEGGP
jgi:hypothetical protein